MGYILTANNRERAEQEKLYRFAVVATEVFHRENGLSLRSRLIIHTNDEKRADEVLAALNKGRVYMKSADGDFEYAIIHTDKGYTPAKWREYAQSTH